MARAGKRPRAGVGLRLAVGVVGAGLGWFGARRTTRVAVAGASMRPVLEPGDRLLVHRTSRLRHGDLAVLADPRAPSRSVVKRVDAVRDGAVVVLGENPSASTDSRHYGPVSLRSVQGRAWYRYAPPDRAGRLTSPRRRQARRQLDRTLGLPSAGPWPSQRHGGGAR